MRAIPVTRISVVVAILLAMVFLPAAPPARAEGGNAVPPGPRVVGRGFWRCVAFVCDASKPTGDGFIKLQSALQEAVDSMRPCQGFDVLFFGGSAFTVCNGGMLASTPDNKRAARQLIQSIQPDGERDPLPAIAAAFSEAPDNLYVLIGGDWKGRDQLANCIRQLNAEHKVKVSFVLVAGQGATDGFRADLKSIAEENGGFLRIIEAEKAEQPATKPTK